MTLSIVGIDFPNPDRSRSNRRMECLLCAPGDAVELRPEPKNPYDPNAIAIWSERSVQLGYVSAERAPLVGKRMEQDQIVAIFQAMHRTEHGSNAHVRIRFGGYAPTLPSPAEPTRPNHDDDFPTDPDGSEWNAQVSPAAPAPRRRPPEPPPRPARS